MLVSDNISLVFKKWSKNMKTLKYLAIVALVSYGAINAALDQATIQKYANIDTMEQFETTKSTIEKLQKAGRSADARAIIQALSAAIDEKVEDAQKNNQTKGEFKQHYADLLEIQMEASTLDTGAL